MEGIERSGIFIGNDSSCQYLEHYSDKAISDERKMIQAQIIQPKQEDIYVLYIADSILLNHVNLGHGLPFNIFDNEQFYGDKLIKNIEDSREIHIVGAGLIMFESNVIIGYGKSGQYDGLTPSLEHLEKIAKVYGLEARVTDKQV